MYLRAFCVFKITVGFCFYYENTILDLKQWQVSNNISNLLSSFFNKIFVTLYVSSSSLSIMSLLLCSFKNIPFQMRRLQKLSVLLAEFYNFYGT